VAKSNVDPGQGRLLLRAGTVADAEMIEAVHWSVLFRLGQKRGIESGRVGPARTE
jgi:hypothetical protein